MGKASGELIRARVVKMQQNVHGPVPASRPRCWWWWWWRDRATCNAFVPEASHRFAPACVCLGARVLRGAMAGEARVSPSRGVLGGNLGRGLGGVHEIPGARVLPGAREVGERPVWLGGV